MSLGTGALNVGRGPKHFRPGQGGIHGNPVSGNDPCNQLPTGTVTLNQISGKRLTWPPILTTKVWNIWRGGRGGDSSRCTSANWSVKINMNPQRWVFMTLYFWKMLKWRSIITLHKITKSLEFLSLSLGLTGKIISAITSKGFDISALQMVRLSHFFSSLMFHSFKFSFIAFNWLLLDWFFFTMQ